ncbi:MAG: HNH endonuclease [Pseudomonadota bacterium]
MSVTGVVMDGVLEIPFQVGAMYRRKAEIHPVLGGQQQGGISTPADKPVVILFTGEGGEAHGYHDFWEDETCFHYFGEGQRGDMTMTGGNRAILNHIADGKRLLLFQMTGKSRPCRYRGEFELISWYERPDTPATEGPNRNAIVFKLRPLDEMPGLLAKGVSEPTAQDLALTSTVTTRLLDVRRLQDLFRKRLLGVEKQCRITGVRDTRFLRASHIKPWAACVSGDERVDGHNGLLLTPHVDLLFDRGWIGFESSGELIVSPDLPSDVIRGMGLKLRSGRRCGSFTPRQAAYLAYHREHVLGKKYAKGNDPIQDLFTEVSVLRD